MRKKLMIVGAIPKKNKKIYGGILKSLDILLNSNSFNNFEIIKLDSTQISNPPPNFLIRSLLAFFRFLKFCFKLIYYKPHGLLVFCSDGPSAIEKGIMIYISNFLGIKSFIFPRAGNLINQVNKSKLFREIIRFLFIKSDIFLCQGNLWVKFSENILGIDPKKTRLVSNWTATEKLLDIGKKRVFKSNINPLNIVYTGWLEKEKGIIELMSAFVNLKDSYKIKLFLVGDGSLNKYLKKTIKNNNLKNSVFLLGWLDSNNLESILEKSDIFLLPSWREGMPNSLIEAIATGLPVVTTPVGVIEDYLEDNVSAIFTKPKDIFNLEKSLEKLITDDTLRKTISKNSYEVAKNNFSTKTSLKNFSKIILETLS